METELTCRPSACRPDTLSHHCRAVERVMRLMVRGYAKSLAAVLHHQGLMLLIVTATLAITIMLYVRTPKGYFPQDDTGLIWGSTQASTETSYQAMFDLQQRAAEIVLADVG